MVIDDLSDDEQLTAEVAWSLACREKVSTNRGQGVMVTTYDKNNRRMQELIIEWALFRYEPAQRLWARITETRMSMSP